MLVGSGIGYRTRDAIRSSPMTEHRSSGSDDDVCVCLVGEGDAGGDEGAGDVGADVDGSEIDGGGEGGDEVGDGVVDAGEVVAGGGDVADGEPDALRANGTTRREAPTRPAMTPTSRAPRRESIRLPTPRGAQGVSGADGAEDRCPGGVPGCVISLLTSSFSNDLSARGSSGSRYRLLRMCLASSMASCLIGATSCSGAPELVIGPFM